MRPKKIEDVEISSDVDASSLEWPTDEEANSEANLGMNRSYFDLRGLSWQDAIAALAAERAHIERISAASDNTIEIEAIDEERYADCEDPTFHMDFGVAGAACALSALGCVPFSSCNAGVFGEGYHAESYPLVAFFTKANMLDDLKYAASISETGLHHGANGSIVVYAASIEAIMQFAQALIERHVQL